MSGHKQNTPQVGGAELTLKNTPILLHVQLLSGDYLVSGDVASVNIPDSTFKVAQDASFHGVHPLSVGNYLIFGNLKESGVIAFELVDVGDNTRAVYSDAGSSAQACPGTGMFSGPVICKQL